MLFPLQGVCTIAAGPDPLIRPFPQGFRLSPNGPSPLQPPSPCVLFLKIRTLPRSAFRGLGISKNAFRQSGIFERQGGQGTAPYGTTP